jgi:hypothetical protein
MKTALCFRMLGLVTLVAFGVAVAACSSTGKTATVGDESSADSDACASVEILCPDTSHCESIDGHPGCVADDAASPSPPPSSVGFFQDPDAGADAADDSSSPKVGFFQP